MSVEHGDIMMVLAALLHNQLDRNVFRVRAHHARLRDLLTPITFRILPSSQHRWSARFASARAVSTPMPIRYLWSSRFGRPRREGMTSTRSCPTTNDAAISRSGVSTLMNGR